MVADYFDVNGNKISSPEAAQPGEVYRDVNGKVLQYKDPITKMSETVAPIAGRLGAEALPAIGSAVGVGGTLVGTGLMQRLKSLKPEIFGEQPQGVDAVANVGKELLLNNVFPALAGKSAAILKEIYEGGAGAAAAKRLVNFPAVREGVIKRLSGNIQQQLDPQTLKAGGYEMMPDYQPVGDVQPITIKPAQPQIPLRKGQSFRPAEPAFTIPGPQVESGGLKIGDMIGIGGKDIKAEDALAELTGKNASRYMDSMPKETYNSTKQMLSVMKDLQKSNTTDRVINYANGRLVWGLGGAGVGALFGHTGIGTVIGLAGKESPVVINSFLKGVMEKPEVAKLVTAAMLTPASAPQAGLIQKALTEVLPRVVADVAATPDK